MAIIEDKKKVEVVDINKLRPELMELSDAEFERREAEFLLAKAERDRIKKDKEEEAKKAINNAIKAKFALACSEMLAAEIMPEWVDLERIRAKDGAINFYRALKVAKPTG